MRKKVELIMHHVLHILEVIIALLTLAVLIVMLGLELYKMFTTPDYFTTRIAKRSGIPADHLPYFTV